MSFGIVQSCTLAQVKPDQGAARWVSLLRLKDGSEYFAGLDNQHGKAVAEAAHRNTYSVGLEPDKLLPALPVMHDPVSRHASPIFSHLPAGWELVMDEVFHEVNVFDGGIGRDGKYTWKALPRPMSKADAENYARIMNWCPPERFR